MNLRDLAARSRRSILKSIAVKFGEPLDTVSKPLIIAPHPDDEVLGCGGLLSKLAASGSETHILFLTEGGGSHRGCCAIDEAQVSMQRRCAAFNAAAVLGIPKENLCFLDGTDGRLPKDGQPGFLQLSERISKHIESVKPDTVFCPHPSEMWSDHMAAAELTRAAMAFQPALVRPRLYYYCVWFWYSMPLMRAVRIDWRRARLRDISAHSHIKQQAMRAYRDPLAPCGKPWSGNLPPEFLRAFDWNKELFFEAMEI